MAIPTFASVELVSEAERETHGSPTNRTTIETVPDVAGGYAVTFPRGPKPIAVTGILSTTSGSAAAALTALRAMLDSRDALVGSYGTYAGTDGTSLTACVLQSYQEAGQVIIQALTGGAKAHVPIRAMVIDLSGT